MKTSASTLEFAIAGLLGQKPQSGYDLRRTFATNMRYYSDSPGSIYPALRRLEARGWIASEKRRGSGKDSRGRQVFRLAGAGKAALVAWLEEPVPEDVSLRLAELMLRFAFMDGNVPRTTTLFFLKKLGNALAARAAAMRERYEEMSEKVPLGTRLLSFESGIESIEAQVRWARSAHARLGKGKG